MLQSLQLAGSRHLSKNLHCNLVVSLDMFSVLPESMVPDFKRFSTTASSNHRLVVSHHLSKTYIVIECLYLSYTSREHGSKQEVRNNCFAYSVVGIFSLPIENLHYIFVLLFLALENMVTKNRLKTTALSNRHCPL